MDKWEIEFLKELREKRKTYRDMIEFCGDDLILNNYIIPELAKQNIFFETLCGDEWEYLDEEGNIISRQEYEQKQENGEEVSEQPVDIYQYFIISGQTAERLQTYTNEIVLYNEDLDLNILCVCHFGTSWGGVPANWKDPEQEQNEDEGGNE